MGKNKKALVRAEGKEEPGINVVRLCVTLDGAVLRQCLRAKTKSVTSLRRGPPLPSKPEYKARLLRASPRRCADGLRIIEAQVTSPHIHTRGGHTGHAGAICHTQSITLTTHGDRVERRRRRQWHARADGLGRGGAATAWAAAALSARARRLCAARARSGAQGSVAARGRAAAVASRRAARARRGGQVIGRRVMGRRVTAPSDRSEPIVARPQLTSKACGARLSVSGGGRHVARREDDKCASYGSLFIGQSSGTQVETDAKHGLVPNHFPGRLRVD